MNLAQENIRLLYLPNEGSKNGRQIEGRLGFETLLAQGELAAYEVFSFWDELEACGDPKVVDEKLFRLAKEFQPTIILWQHPTDYPVNGQLLEAIKALISHPVLVYDERDPYVRWRKPLPSGARVLIHHAHFTFTTGLGDKVKLFQKAGAARVFFSPTCMDSERFMREWHPPVDPPHDVVMITNVNRLNLPFLCMPGSRERIILADRLFSRLGERFAVYGHYWPRRAYVKGPLEFESQLSVLQQSLLSVGLDRFEKTPYYFSDRLPISMLSGVPHVTNYKPGFDQMFRNGIDLFYAKSINELIDTVCYLLSLPCSELVRLGRQQQEYALKYLTPVPVFRNLLVKVCEDRKRMLTLECD